MGYSFAMARGRNSVMTVLLGTSHCFVACTPHYEGQMPGDCLDQIDNDGDGFIDCEDDGCAPGPDCGTPSDADPPENDTGPNDTGPIDTPPYGEDLIVNGDFPDINSGPWTLDSCLWTNSLSWVDTEGWALSGLQADGDAPIDCEATQRIELIKQGFSAEKIDSGTLNVTIEALVSSDTIFGSFGDLAWAEIRFFNEAEEQLGVLQTMFGGSSEWTLRTGSGLVPPGTRQIEVAFVGQHRATWANKNAISSLAMWIDSVTPAEPIITIQPVLQSPEQTEMTLLWETDSNQAFHAVSWGPTGSALSERTPVKHSIQVSPSNFVHVAVLNDLQAGTEYDYQVISGETESSIWTFKTAPPADEPVRIVWMSDNQTGSTTFGEIIGQAAEQDPDLLFSVGDIVEDGYILEEWADLWFSPLQTADFAQTTPILFARGNHDRGYPYAYAYSSLPGNGFWYSFSYGDIFVVVLDSQYSHTSERSWEDQAAFLAQALQSEAALSASFKIVTFHQPPYTNSQGSEWDGNEDSRVHWVPILEDNDVDLVICGHSHVLARGDNNGVRYLIVGGAGAPLFTSNNGYWDWFTLIEPVHHHAIMDVADGVMSWTVYDQLGETIDQFSISK